MPKPAIGAPNWGTTLNAYLDSQLLSVEDYGVATGNTATQNSSAFATANTAAVTAGARLFIPAGTYSFNTISIGAPLHGVGNASVLSAQTITVNASNVTLSALKINGQSSTAISVANVNDLTLRDIEVTHAGGVTNHLAADIYNVSRLSVTGCKFGIGGLQLSLSEDFTISGNTWDCQYLNVNEPMHISGQSYGTVMGNHVANTATDAIDLYSAGHYCAIIGNTFIGLKGAAGIECKVVMSDDVNNTSSPGNTFEGTVIANNTLRDFISVSTSTRQGIYAEYLDNRAAPVFSVAETNHAIVITGNTLQDFNKADPGGGIIGNWWGIAFTGHNGLITNNVIRNARTWNASVNLGIKLAAPTTPNATKCVGVRVAGNVIAGIQGTAGTGIEVGNLDRCQIDGNIVRGDEVAGTQTKFGVSIVAGATLNHCSISDNMFECNDAAGFGLRTASSTATVNHCKIQGNIFKDCGSNIHVAQYTLFSGNSLDNATNSQNFAVGVASTYSIGNTYCGNHFTMSADYALSLTDHDAFVITGNSFKDTTRGVLLNGNTKNGTVTSNVSVNQTGGVEFPHFSGVSAADQASIRAGLNVVNGALPFPDPGRLVTITGIDAKTTGTTTLYTVPTGKTAVITKAVVRCTAATAITVAPTLGIGVAAGEADIFASVVLTGLTTTATVWTFGASGLAVPVAAAGVIKVGIDTAATGTSQTIAIDLFGYLV